MHYEINVALNGHHFFATDERSITNKSTLKKVWEVMIKKFPKEEGYSIDVTYYEERGTTIYMDKVN